VKKELHEILKDSYLNWLREKIVINSINDAIQITTPFMDSNNDHLQIYAIPNGSDSLRLTDDGYIISDLLMSGVDLKGQHRFGLLNQIIRGYGINLSDEDELFVEATIDNYPQKKHMLLQAMMSVSDMFLTTKSIVQNLFIEDVESFLIKNDVSFISDVNFNGRSGFTHKFDFVIPRSKVQPERIIKTLNNPSKDSSSSILFSWNDTKETRKPDTQLFAFLNDTEKTINKEVLSAFKEYQVKPILWSEKNKYIDILTA
jgi:hypothetical protein